MKRNDTRGRVKSGLTRSKSMGSLQSGARSIGALKALFEAPQSKTSSSSPDKAADVMPAEKGEAKEGKSSAEEPKIQIPPDSTADAAKTHAKGDVTRRVNTINLRLGLRTCLSPGMLKIELRRNNVTHTQI